MMAGSLRLPQGRQGKIAASAITVLALTLLWFGAIAPLAGWYEARQAVLTEQTAIAARMGALVGQLPQLRTAISARGSQSLGEEMLLAGESDAIAGANLQSAVQNLAVQAGTNLDSAEMMPVQQQGALRQIGMQVSLKASWPVLIAFLEAISTTRPRMIVGELNLANPAQQAGGQGPMIQANFSVSGFRSGVP